MKNNSFEDLKDKVCVITGGAGVIGASMVEVLASAGVKVAILDLREEVASELANKIQAKYNVECCGFATNVLDKATLTETKKEVIKKFGKVDILINGAGGNSPEATTKLETLDADSVDKLEEGFFGLKMEGFQKVFDLNFIGTLLPTMVFGEEMVKRGSGSVVNISSMNSYKPLTKIPAYSAAKAAVNNFTEWLAVHFAKTGVRVNAIAPGFFLTNQNRFLLIDEKTGGLTPRGQKIISNTPMAKYGEPEDLQGTLLFLTSDISSFITGIVIPVDGGYSAFGGV
ncbi:MAG: SDR family oxidoreductase [Bacteroidales bacterium]|nr:SDR family oxidoreductase [Bacteroidales bacterium]MCF8391811.1 SDR family oxidoreductase [Bacteroidales bacterium]